MCEKFNETSLDTIAGALCEMMGIDSPKGAAKGNKEMLDYVNEVFGGEKADECKRDGKNRLRDGLRARGRTDLPVYLRTGGL